MNPNSHRILIVEDDADDRYLIHLALSEIAYEDQVKVFERAEDLLRHLKSLPESSMYPALVVTDLNLPGMNGSELLMRMQLDDDFRDIPIAIYTNGGDALSSRMLTMGATYYFEKGNDLKSFLQLVQKFKKIAEGEEVLEER